MRGWTKRKICEDRVCFCGQVFNPTHQKEVCCSPNCKSKAHYRQTLAYLEKWRARIAAGESVTWQTTDGHDRSTARGWSRYCRDNPFYLAGLYPNTDLSGAVQDMRMRGVL